MSIYELIITCAPSVTAIISIVCAVVSVVKKISSLKGEMATLKSVVSTVTAENKALKTELSKVYKLHSEIVDHIYYKESTDEQENA